jgi:hypothetical protein
MAVTFNLLVTEELHSKISDLTIDFNYKALGAITKTQMCNILLELCFKHHSNKTLLELSHLILHPPTKKVRSIAKDGKKIAVQNQN